MASVGMGNARMLGRETKRDGQGAAGRRRPPVRSLLVIVLLLSLGLVAVTVLNYRTAVRVADETLQNQGVRIGLELAAEARARDAWDGPALQALVAEQHRRDVAFVTIIDRDGTVLAHSNARLIRRRDGGGAKITTMARTRS